MDLCYVGPFIFRYAAQSVCNQTCETKCFCVLCKPTPHPSVGLGLNLDEMLSIQLNGIGIKTKPSGEKSRTATHWVN